MERKISTLYLKLGMYVSSLDRPWEDTPFIIQGFFLNNDEDIHALEKYCDHVFIDPDKGIEAEQYFDEEPKLKTNQYLEKYLLGEKKKKIDYVDKKTPTEEMPQAKVALEKASDQVASIMDSVKSGGKLDVDAVRGVVEPMLESIIRNSEALMWLKQLRKKDSYTYTHSVDNCALAIAFGRHMGLTRTDIRALSIGMLLMDVGKMRVPEEILNKTSTLTDEEFREVKKHVIHSVDILRNTEGISEDSINIAMTHHERFDGSGYPNGLVGSATPVFGRIAAIIDCYDAMTSKRPYGEPVSPHAALQEIYNWREKYFQPELVEQFLQCLGVYPTGTLIEMNTGEVGVVLAQNKTRRLMPKVMMLMDADKKLYDDYPIIDLMVLSQNEAAEPMNIIRGLDPGAYGIDPSEFYL
jgi:HD-GYP domain-containing protein (c-di-GMP phosphodiesterase class II)